MPAAAAEISRRAGRDSKHKRHLPTSHRDLERLTDQTLERAQCESLKAVAVAQCETLLAVEAAQRESAKLADLAHENVQALSNIAHARVQALRDAVGLSPHAGADDEASAPAEESHETLQTLGQAAQARAQALREAVGLPLHVFGSEEATPWQAHDLSKVTHEYAQAAWTSLWHWSQDLRHGEAEPLLQGAKVEAPVEPAVLETQAGASGEVVARPCQASPVVAASASGDVVEFYDLSMDADLDHASSVADFYGEGSRTATSGSCTSGPGASHLAEEQE